MNLRATKIVICGPTASGKSALALQLARRLDAAIVNFDSQQVYEEIPIISAQPTKYQQQNIPHYLYSVISGKTASNVADWLRMAIDVVETIPMDKPIIFVGGTGLYLNALLNGLSPIPEIPTEVRRHVRNLSFADVALQLAHPDANDQRMRRRLEVKLATGKDIEEFYKQPVKHYFNPLDFAIYNITVPRETTYASINHRFDWIIDNGGLEEIQMLDNKSYSLDLPIMKACGVKEIISYLNNCITLEQAKENAKQATRNYAKRQMTWFRHKLPSHKIDLEKISVDLILKDLENLSS